LFLIPISYSVSSVVGLFLNSITDSVFHYVSVLIPFLFFLISFLLLIDIYCPRYCFVLSTTKYPLLPPFITIQSWSTNFCMLPEISFLMYPLFLLICVILNLTLCDTQLRVIPTHCQYSLTFSLKFEVSFISMLFA
jgi:hypothetical protein